MNSAVPGEAAMVLAGHHHPMLQSMAVSLQADALAGANAQPLHQITIPRCQGLEPPPGALADHQAIGSGA